MHQRASLSIGLPAVLLFLGGCIIVDGSTSSGGFAGGGGTGNTTKTTASSSSSSSGKGGAGGEGTSSNASVGGSGGGCVKEGDGMLDKLSCEKLNTWGKPNCPDMFPPLANGTCTRGFEIYQSGAADVLSKCLQGILGDPTNACDTAQVSACVDLMYKSACPDDFIANTCLNTLPQGCNVGTVFDTQTCQQQLNPFNSAAVTELINCMNDLAATEPDCNKAYSTCFDQVRSFAVP